jgi:hypothetical protein
MPSTIPLVLGVLIFTGAVSAVWRLLRTLMSRGKAAPSNAGDAIALRIDAARELLWTILLLVQFVFIEALSESREVSQALDIVGSVASGLCLIAALVALISCIAAERALISNR